MQRCVGTAHRILHGQLALNILDGFKKSPPGVFHTLATQNAFGVDKYHMLTRPVQHPENEVWEKITRFKKADASAP
jgi:hypothetical protein